MAARFTLSAGALFRHRQGHLPERLLNARDARETSKAKNLIAQIETLQTRAKQILEKAESGGDLRTALAGVKELSRLIELVARMTREQFRGADPATATVDSVDDATATKMAEAFLARVRKEQP